MRETSHNGTYREHDITITAGSSLQLQGTQQCHYSKQAPRARQHSCRGACIPVCMSFCTLILSHAMAAKCNIKLCSQQLPIDASCKLQESSTSRKPLNSFGTKQIHDGEVLTVYGHKLSVMAKRHRQSFGTKQNHDGGELTVYGHKLSVMAKRRRHPMACTFRLCLSSSAAPTPRYSSRWTLQLLSANPWPLCRHTGLPFCR